MPVAVADQAVKPAAGADVGFQAGIPHVGEIKTTVSKETANDLVKVLSGAAATVLGVVAVLVFRGRGS